MESPVFGNEFFDQWLNQKSNEILAKVEREKISNEDMLILSLKAQVNHFHHMDIEFREEFRKIDKRFEEFDKRLSQDFSKVDKRFEESDKRLSQDFNKVDKRFEESDKRFERQMTYLTWGFGLVITTQIALILKLFLND